MKLKHYLGALLMAGSVVAISFPADANPGIRLCQRFCKQYAAPLVKQRTPLLAESIKKITSKPNFNRPIGLMARDGAKLITDEIATASKVLPRISTPNITSGSPQLASPPPVVPTQPTGNEQEALKQQISRYGIPAGGTIIVSSGYTVVHLNSQNSERTPIRSPIK